MAKGAARVDGLVKDTQGVVGRAATGKARPATPVVDAGGLVEVRPTQALRVATRPPAAPTRPVAKAATAVVDVVAPRPCPATGVAPCFLVDAAVDVGRPRVGLGQAALVVETVTSARPAPPLAVSRVVVPADRPL